HAYSYPIAAPLRTALSPYTTLFRSALLQGKRPHRHGTTTINRVENHLRAAAELVEARVLELLVAEDHLLAWQRAPREIPTHVTEDRKSTRLNSSHVKNSYAVFCLKT